MGADSIEGGGLNNGGLRAFGLSRGTKVGTTGPPDKCCERPHRLCVLSGDHRRVEPLSVSGMAPEPRSQERRNDEELVRCVDRTMDDQ